VVHTSLQRRAIHTAQHALGGAQQRAQRAEQRLIAGLRARNEEMEQFVYTVSHDLKSPLVTIKGFLGAITHELDAGRTDRVRADMARIAVAADRMMTLLSDLLELSRAGRVGTLAPVRIHEVVGEALDLVAGAIVGRGVDVWIDPAVEALPPVPGDRGRLVQVAQNLIENAAKYLGDQAAPRIEVGVRGGPGGPTWYVRDNGIGIAPQHVEPIFGLFEKPDPRSPGTGVGLARVRPITEFHGGRVWVESDGPRLGSTFVVAMGGAGPR